MTEIIQFFIQSKTARKRLLLSCRLAIRKQVTISYALLCYFLYCYFLYSTQCQIKKLLLKEIEKNKQTNKQNTKQVKFCGLCEMRSFSREPLKFFQKQGHYSHSRRDGENWTKMGRSLCRVERDNRPVKKFDAMFSAPPKTYLLLWKRVSHFIVVFSLVWSNCFRLTFSYAILTSYLETILFRV